MPVLKVDQKNLKLIIKKAVKSIKRGEIMVCPTDTVYGLVADATNKKAVEKLFKIKERSRKPIPIFIKDLKTAKKTAQINKEQEKFLKRAWPGKVTAVLTRKNKLPKILFGKRTTIGLRIPKYKLVQELLKKINRPLTGTSANISGKPATTKIKKIIKQFKNQRFQPDLILDAGDLEPSKPSMVIDLTGSKQKILRK